MAFSRFRLFATLIFSALVGFRRSARLPMVTLDTIQNWFKGFRAQTPKGKNLTIYLNQPFKFFETNFMIISTSCTFAD